MKRLLTSGGIRILFSCCLSFIINQLPAQVQSVNFRHYSLAEGLSAYKVVKVLQDRFGFMWVATQDGLNRFDGKGITIYNKIAPEKHLLSGSDITDMVEDTSRNILWAISSYGGLDGIDLTTGHVKHTVPVSDPASRFVHPWLKSLVLCKGELWIGTSDGITVYNPDRRQFTTIRIPLEKAKNTNYGFDIHLQYTDEFDRVWVFIASYGLVIFSGTNHSFIVAYDLPTLHLPAGFKYKRYYTFRRIASGEGLLATHAGVKRIVYNSSGLMGVSDETLPGTHNDEVAALDMDREGNLWYATAAGMFRYHPGKKDYAMIRDVNKTDQKKWLNSVNFILFDRNHFLWLGTLQGFALAAHTRSPFLNFYQSPDLSVKMNRVWFIFPFNDSAEYVCADDGLYRVNNVSSDIKQLKGGGLFAYMFRHSDGNLIAGSEDRLFVFHPPDRFTGIEKVYPELFDLKDEAINSAVHWGDSVFFIGSEAGKGVYKWNYKRKTLSKIDDRTDTLLESGIVNALYKDQGGKLWILSDNSFAVFDPVSERIKNFELVNPVTGRPLNLFFDVCEAGGSYWLASYGEGIVQLDKNYRVKKIISKNDGLANAGIYKIFPVDNSFLLVTSNYGLSKINIQNFSVSNYFQSDGLHSNAFEEHSGIMKNGKIYAGGPEGFTIIDADQITPNTIAPKVYITGVTTETKEGITDTSGFFLETIRLPGNLLQARVHFSGINYSNPERTTFVYRIKEQHDEWLQLGYQNSLQLTRLPPGNYTLQVKALNEDGLAGTEKEIRLIFMPRWYQTWWFRAMVILLLASIIFAMFRLRINRLQKEKEIRSHLAHDLHDDLGSTLNSVKVYTSLAIMEGGSNHRLEKINQAVQEAITGVKDVIWVLDDKKDTPEHLLTRISQFAAPLCVANDIAFLHQLGESLNNYKLGKEEKRNLYMIIKETINNSVKYANCKTIRLNINRPAGKLIIKITDDGIGFDKENITSGDGLKNMLSRCREIDYRAEIISLPGKGTVVELDQN